MAVRVFELRLSQVGLSRRLYVRPIVVGLVVTVVGFFAFAFSISLGEFSIPVADVIRTLLGKGDPGDELVIEQFRLPRATVALLAGMAFASSGAIFQSLARNPLVSPDVIGTTSGASFLAVLVIVNGASSTLVWPAAFVGGLLASLFVYVVAYRNGLSSYRLVLVGIGLTAILEAGIVYLIASSDIRLVQQALIWTVGTVYARTWQDVGLLALGLGALLPFALVLLRQLEILQLGDELATSLGSRVELIRGALVTIGVGLAAFAVASTGPLAFVAFVAPLIARGMIRRPGAPAIGLAAVVGGVLVLVADIPARQLFAPAVLPVGIVTTLIGAPYFLFLLFLGNRRGVGG